MSLSKALFNGSAAALLAALFAAPASAEDVRLRSTHPIVYGAYDEASAENEFRVGTPAEGALTNVYGDVDVIGDVVITKPDNCRVRVGPSMGPYDADSFRVDTIGNVQVSLPPVANFPRVKVSTVLIGGDFYAMGDPADTPTVVGIMRGYLDPDTSLTAHLRRKALFASRPADAVTLDPTAGTYAPLRMDGREVQFGIEYNLRSTDEWGGVLNRVLIGTREPWTPPAASPQPEVFLQIGQPLAAGDPALTTPDTRMAGVDGVTPGLIAPPGGAGSGWRIFSSRDYKTDIAPMTAAQRGDALEAIARLDVVRYRFNGEPSSSALHTGLIAEDLPETIRSPGGKSLNIAEAYAFAAAALKALKTENDALKARLAALESAEAGR